jgi:hypothetical protein
MQYTTYVRGARYEVQTNTDGEMFAPSPPLRALAVPILALVNRPRPSYPALSHSGCSARQREISREAGQPNMSIQKEGMD